MLRITRTLCLVVTVLLSAAAAFAEPRVFDDAWLKVKRHFYDRKLHGLDWDDVRDRFRPEAEAAQTPAEEYAVIRRMLAELKASHTALIEEDVYRNHFECEMNGKRSRQGGVEIAGTEEGYFVTAVLEGSRADAAGVRKGDRIVRINGASPERSGLLADAGGDAGIPGDPHFFLQVPEAGGYELALQSERGARPRVVRFEPSTTNMIEATRNSARVIESGDRRFGYIHLWHFLSGRIADHFDRAIDGPLRDCDGLVLDIRGRGGNVFVLERVLARLRRKSSWFSRGRRWTRPVVLLIDENSRSAKEIFAHKFKRERLGPVVGRRTPGAVLGSTFFPLADGSVLLLPITDVSMLSDGVRLEGEGVAPTVEVRQPDRWTGGKDLILEEGVRRLHRAILLREAI